MVNFVKDIDKDIKRLNTSTFELGTNLKDIKNGSTKAAQGISQLSSTLKSTEDLGTKAAKSLKAVGFAGAGLATGALAAVDLSSKIGALVTIGNAAYTTFKQLSGVSGALKFEQAILGTTTLSDNFEYLERTSNKALDSIKLGLQAAFDGEGFTAFTGKAVAAYAPVEQAAYRLSTVTVASGERSVDALGKNIASMRKLQSATKDALGSVELLNAQYDIASAGFTTPEANLGVGKASVNLSQAGFGDLGGATNANVRVLRALGEGAEQADLRASQLFETTRVGLVTLDQLTPIIGSLSVQSKQLGVDFSEVTAAIAGLTTQGSSAGEAGTQLESLFAEITNASPEANKQLSAFRDELGKPIQLNAASLKSKGIRGIIKDIQSATGGDVAKIQGLFSSKESTQAVQSLISLGDKAFGEYTDRIKNVDTSDLGKEAEGRTKTISGAFSKAQNTSQKQVEEFGSGFGGSVVEQVLESDKAFKTFATGSAEAIGKITGSVSGLVNKMKAVGGFVGTAFSTILPFVFFSVVTKGAADLFSKIKSSAKPGETIWTTIKRKAIDSFADIYVKWQEVIDKIIAKARSGAKDIRAELKKAAKTDNAGTDSKNKTTSTEKSNKSKDKSSAKQDFSDVISTDSFSTDSLKSNRSKKIKTPDAPKVSLPASIDIPKAKGFAGLKNSITGLKDSATKGFSAIKGAGELGFKGLGGAAKLAGPFVGQVGGILAGVGVAGIAAAGALAIGSGWMNTMGQLLDKRTNPALAQMAESLTDIKNVEGLSTVLKEFDKTTSSIEGTSYGMNVLNESLTRGAGLWNQVTGASYGLETQTIPQLDRVNKLLDDQIAKNKEAAAAGKIGTNTLGGQRAEDKLNKGITLGGDDETALKNEVKEKQQVITARIANEELKLAEIEKNGSAEAKVGLEDKKSALKTLKDQSEVEKKSLDTALQKKLVQQQIQRFKSIDTSIPLQLQLEQGSRQGIQAQIKEIKDTLNTKEVDILGDPEKYAAQFADVSKRLDSAVDAIQIELEFNVGNASDLRKQLIDEVGAENFDKFVASDPKFRKKVTDLNQGITSGVTTQAQNVEKADTSVLDAAQSLGSESTTVAAAKFGAQTTAINSQVKALGEELARPETTLNRQKEIIAQIEELEGKRASLDADARISKELGSRKQQLSLEQQILDVKNATLNLFNQESKFGSLAISAAQAKVDAAQQELKFKKESLAIEGKETVIKKEEVVKALEKRQDRSKEQANAGSGGIDYSDPKFKEQFADKTNKFKEEELKKAEGLKATNVADSQRKSQEITKSSKVFSKEEQAKIVEAETLAATGGQDTTSILGDFGLREKVKKRTFNDDGTIKDEEAVRKRAVENSSVNGLGTNADFSQRARDANDVFSQKELESLQKQDALKNSTKSDNNRIDQNSKSTIETRQGITDLVNKKADETAGSNSNLSGVIGDNKASSKGAEDKNVEASKEPGKESSKDGEITAQSDLAFSKAVESIKNRLGSMAQRVALNEAKIQQEFAGREKLIKRGELLGESLSALASKSDIFGDSVAGAQLQLQALQTTNSSEKLQAEGDKEIATINQKVKDLSQNATDAAAAAAEARAAGADEKTVNKLDSQASDAAKLASTANKEKNGDIAFVKQATAAAKLNAQLEINIATINAEFASRERIIKQGEQLGESLSGLIGKSDLFGESAIGAKLSLEALKLQKSPDKIDATAEKDSLKVDERVKALQQSAKDTDAALAEAISSGADTSTISSLQKQSKAANKTATDGVKEAAGDKEQIKQKAAIDKLTASVDITIASINSEYSAREKLSKQTNAVADGFASLAGATLLQNSAASAFLTATQAKIKQNDQGTNVNADKKIDLINARIESLSKLAQQPGAVGDKAREQLDTAKKEATGDIAAVNNERAFGLIASDLEASSAALEKETAAREKVTEMNSNLISSFSSVASTLSSLFSNSSIGSALNKFTAQLNVSNNKSGKEYQKQATLLDERSAQLSKAVKTAKDNGASKDVVAGLEQAKSADDKQRPLEKSYLRQKAQLDGLNDRLGVMAAGVQEVSDKLSKQATVIKEGIELEDRKRASAADNNKSGTGLQSALVNFLGKNNPVAQQLQQRLEVQQGRDDATNQQASNVSDAKKEIIDTTVLKSQLDLELKSYENAITQTALLSDLVSVSQGGSANSSASADIRKQLDQLPQLLAAGRAQAAARGSLLDDKLKFIPQELEGKQANVKRNLLASELGTLGSKLNPANIDLLTRTLSDTENQVKGFKRSDIQVGSLQDKAFQDQLAKLGGSKIPAPARSDSLVNNRIGNGLPTANAAAGGRNVSINSPINIKIDASAAGGDSSKLNALIKETTATQVNQGLQKLSTKVLEYSKQF
jgi:hypothetical protein